MAGGELGSPGRATERRFDELSVAPRGLEEQVDDWSRSSAVSPGLKRRLKALTCTHVATTPRFVEPIKNG